MSSLIWNGTVQHSHRRLNTSPLHSLRSSRHASSHDTRNFRSSAPFFEFTPNEWTIILEKQQSLAWRCTCWRDFIPHQWQNLLRHQPTLLHYCEILDHPAVRSGLLASDSYFSTDIDMRMISLCATGSGASSTTRVLGITALVRNSSRNRCGGVFFTVQPSCCQIAHTFTCSATRTGAGSTFFRS